MSSATLDWQVLNRTALRSATARMRTLLENRIHPDSARAGCEPARITGSALETLSTLFGLSGFERDLLVLCAAVEIEPDVRELCAVAQHDPSRPFATFGLALDVLPDPHWSAIGPQAALRGWHLLEPIAEGPLLLAPLTIDERILHFLVGVEVIDARLASLAIEVSDSGTSLMPSQAAIAAALSDVWRTASLQHLPVLQLSGQDVLSRRAIAARACAQLGFQLWAMSAEFLVGVSAELVQLARLWEREAWLEHRVLMLECDDLGDETALSRTRVFHLLERLRSPTILSGHDRPMANLEATVAFDVPRPSGMEQRAAWREFLGDSATSLNGALDRLVSQFSLDSGAMSRVLERAGAQETRGLEQRLWQACRDETRPRLAHLAQRIIPARSWRDLVLPELQMRLLRQIAAQGRRRVKVHEEWGFLTGGDRGAGISVLFHGESGTGKTMAAEVLAGELGLDVYRVDLSQVVSKYIGETEKNLRHVFDSAEAGGAVLLFDEADVLFGRRSEVKDSHDRYANIEIGYLLQRMETYRGIAILTTNFKSAMDSAFRRRLRFIVHFPFPDQTMREELWRRAFPPATTEDLDFSRLARLTLSGGSIRNISLQAAFLAADEDSRVGMNHLQEAIRTEFANLERPLAEAEVAGWR